MAFRIFKDLGSNSVIFDSTIVDTRAVNTLQAVQVNGAIDVNDIIINRTVLSGLGVGDVLNQEGDVVGPDLDDVIDYLNFQFSSSYVVDTSSAGIVSGLDLFYFDDRLFIQPGVCRIRADDPLRPGQTTLIDLTLDEIIEVPIPDPGSGLSRLYRINMVRIGTTNNITYELSEIGDQDVAFPPSDVIRSDSFIGTAVHDEFDNWTGGQTFSIVTRDPVSTVADLAFTLGGRQVTGESIEMLPLVDRFWGITAGKVFLMGSNKLLGGLENPNIFDSPALIPVPDARVEYRDGSGGIISNPDGFQGGQLQINPATPIWEVWDDDSGTLQAVPAEHWVICPVFVFPAQLEFPSGTGNQVNFPLPIILVAQNVIPESAFRVAPEAHIQSAVNSFKVYNALNTSGIFIGALAMRQDAIDVNDSDKFIFKSGRKDQLVGPAILESANLALGVINISGNVHVDPVNGSDADGDGSITSPYQTIQKAYDEADANDTIQLAAGTYTLGSTVNFAQGKGINITGLNKDNTFIEYEDTWSGSALDLFQLTTAIGSEIFRFKEITFRNCRRALYFPDGAGVVQAEKCCYVNCGWNGLGITLNGVAGGGNVGIDSTPAELATFAGTTNVIPDFYAVDIVDAHACSFNDNLFNSCMGGLKFTNCGVDNGILPDYARGVSVRRNNFIQTLDGAVFLDSSTGDASAGCSRVWLVENGIRNCGGSGVHFVGGDGLILDDSAMRVVWDSGVLVEHGSAVIVNRNHLRDCHIVDTNWAGVAPGILGAVAIDGDTIDVTSSRVLDITGCSIERTGNFDAYATNPVGVNLGSSLGDLPQKECIAITNNLFDGNPIAVYIQDGALRDGSGDRIVSLWLIDNKVLCSEGVFVENLDGGLYMATALSNHGLGAASLIDFSIDVTKTSITVNPGDTFNINQLQAVEEDTTFVIIERNTDRIQYDNIDPLNVTINGVPLVDQSLSNTVNELNALFTQTGSIVGDPPTLTSPTVVNVNIGDPVNYLVTGDNISTVYWDTLPTGIVPDMYNFLRLGGQAPLVPGVYNAVGQLRNAFGVTPVNITFNASSPSGGLNLTRSVQFPGSNDRANVNNVGPTYPLARTGPGAGAADSWSVATWVKRTAIFPETIWEIGNNGNANSPRIRLTTDFFGDLNLRYGSDPQNININVSTALTFNAWDFVVVTYDGNTTGTDPGSINDYYSRFRIYVNNVEFGAGTGSPGNATGSNSGNGFSGNINSNSLDWWVGNGRRTSNFGGRIAMVEVFDYELLPVEVNTLWNGGSPYDSLLLPAAKQPEDRWLMGSDAGDAFPNLVNSGNSGVSDLVMVNMNAGDIVTDAPT